jgi:hypothetical protein
LNGDKVLIKGNHDIFRLEEYTEHFREIRAYHVLSGMILSHIPIHETSLGRFGVNIHGHLHSNRVMKDMLHNRGVEVIDPRYHCVCVEQTDFRPILFEDVIKKIEAEGGAVGFKNGTDGNIKIAVDAMKAASQPHHFLSVTKGGHSAIVSTSGNEDCHVILRGGKAPNFDAASVEAACSEMAKSGLAQRVMIDSSHANSNKKPENQPAVCADVGGQIAQGETRIMGLMIESNLVAGRQDLVPGQPLVYGQSVTDGCIDWDSSLKVLEGLAESVRERRRTLLKSEQ